MTQPENPISPPSASAAEESPSKGPSGGLCVRLFARTDVGQVREHNEDNFLVADLTERTRSLPRTSQAVGLGRNGALFAVCDGMGGAAAGEIASQLAVDILYEHMVESLDPSATLSRNELARRLVRAVETAGLRIFQEAKVDRSRRGMGTTVTAAALLDDHLFLAQVGDSRAYILRGETLTQVTRDQSLVNQLIEAGQLTEEEAETFEHNNIILQALGTSETVQVDLTYAPLHRGDRLLICSDGLSGMVRTDEIRESLKGSTDPIETCKVLTERANHAGGHDNITVIVAHFDGEALPSVGEGTPPLRYQKYSLPEEPSEQTAPHGRLVVPSESAQAHGADGAQGAQRHSVAGGTESPSPDGNGSLTNAGASSTGPRSQDNRLTPLGMDEPVDLPGTDVPSWVVALLLAIALLTLGGAGFVFLRN